MKKYFGLALAALFWCSSPASAQISVQTSPAFGGTAFNCYSSFAGVNQPIDNYASITATWDTPGGGQGQQFSGVFSAYDNTVNAQMYVGASQPNSVFDCLYEFWDGLGYYAQQHVTFTRSSRVDYAFPFWQTGIREYDPSCTSPYGYTHMVYNPGFSGCSVAWPVPGGFGREFWYSPGPGKAYTCSNNAGNMTEYYHETTWMGGAIRILTADGYAWNKSDCFAIQR